MITFLKYTGILVLVLAMLIFVVKYIRKKAREKRMKRVSECSFDWYHRDN